MRLGMLFTAGCLRAVHGLVQVMGGVGGHHTAAEGRYLMLGNGFLLLNTLAMALYYLWSARIAASTDIKPAPCTTITLLDLN